MNRATPSWIRSLVATLLAGCLIFAAPLAQTPAEDVSLSGRIFQADGSTPYANVTIRILDKETGQEVATTTTDNDGSYAFEGLAPGDYTFEVEVADGIYQLDRAVSLGSAESASISFTVKPTPGAGGGVPPAAAEEGMSKKKKGGLIAIIVSGALFLAWGISELSEDDDRGGASPFTP